MKAAEIAFWCCAAALFYTYIGYPLHVLILARLFPRAIRRAPFTGTVSVLISIHNEAARLPDKIRSLLAGRGASLVGEVLIGSDGSTDNPTATAAEIGDGRVQVHAFPDRRGKASVLNDLMARATCDVIVMTDARQPLAEGALEALLEPFADESVGVVSGHLVFRMPGEASAATTGVGTYWSYEKVIRRAEAETGSVPGATGALYAIRRSLLTPIPAATLLDDVAIPMQAIARGGRCIFESVAVCFDTPSTSSNQEAIRKRRTIAGNIQLLFRHPSWALPGAHPAWWRFFGHKILRLFAPFLFLDLLACSVLLAARPFYAALLLAQVAGWGTAVAALVASRRGIRVPGLLGIPQMFLVLNIVTVLAWWDALCGRYEPAWKRSAV